MRMIITAILILLSGSVAFAVVGGGDLSMKNEGGDVVFSHEAHVKTAGLKCHDCHAKIYLNSKNHMTVTMAEMEKGQSCGTCHDDTAAFGVRENCEKCHAQVQENKGGSQ